ncbi:uncharacterized protein [Choristoneura fumiferana]|uniref:uncharacterized protein n=1 Tax=Choristoneura fumiferana TaxID=7141 RepID=UPI003D15563E
MPRARKRKRTQRHTRSRSTSSSTSVPSSSSSSSSSSSGQRSRQRRRKDRKQSQTLPHQAPTTFEDELVLRTAGCCRHRGDYATTLATPGVTYPELSDCTF